MYQTVVLSILGANKLWNKSYIKMWPVRDKRLNI